MLASRRAGMVAARGGAAAAASRRQALQQPQRFQSTSPLGWIWNQVKVPKGTLLHTIGG
jgi:hypothetical protein